MLLWFMVILYLIHRININLEMRRFEVKWFISFNCYDTQEIGMIDYTNLWKLIISEHVKCFIVSNVYYVGGWVSSKMISLFLGKWFPKHFYQQISSFLSWLLYSSKFHIYFFITESCSLVVTYRPIIRSNKAVCFSP